MDTRKVNIIFTTDIHGNYFPYDFRHERWGKGSLQRVHAYVAQQVKRLGGSTILIDGGDMLQGEPTSYYYNFVQRGNRHKVADMCNFIGYDVGVIGNHDIETGHEVFDQFVRDCTFPILGANAIDEATGEPYFEPYIILPRSGIRIAIIGFTTPAVPHWIPKRVWSGIRFEDIQESAEHWIQFVREHEHPDFIIGLFHSGMEEGIITPDYRENAVRETVSHVDGFDLVLYGHDHSSNMEEVESPCGRSVMCINPGSYAHSVAEVRLKFSLDSEGKVVKHDMDAQLRYIGTMHNSHAVEFRRHFKRDFTDVQQYASRKIGHFLSGIDITDAYFGSSAYIDFIQQLQLSISHADLSLAAPLFFNASINEGDVKVSDLFNLYRFEDKLYTLRLKGSEIKNYLEMSYANWTNQMHSPDDNLLLLSPMKSNPERMGFTNFIFNFDSIAGLRYTVDVSKPTGEKIRIESLADGTPFDFEHDYSVAMTAYRANGGGELLTKGAGLTKDEIERRILDITPRDIRHYMMEYIEHHQTVCPQALNHWRFVPEEWVRVASERERKLLFGKKKERTSE
ncbi:MAG: bifunctional metallophosphatase/5'-nucleotidase [Bacteroidales bacterium]|nr:bifunctional metallophosphatase/5'-nucleotidase [Bacteroidales bacterium]